MVRLFNSFIRKRVVYHRTHPNSYPHIADSAGLRPLTQNSPCNSLLFLPPLLCQRALMASEKWSYPSWTT